MTVRQAKRTAADRGLSYAAKVLNSNTPRGRRLRRLVALWQASGPDTSKLFAEHPRLWAQFLSAWKPSPMLTRTGAVGLGFGFNAGAEGSMPNLAGERFAAMAIFGALLANPQWDKLGGPCARCQRYYIKNRTSQKVYCSAKCGSETTAISASQKRFEEERAEKLKLAEDWLNKFRKQQGPNATHWKEWIAEHSGLDKRFLAQAARRGDLEPPTTTTTTATKGR